MLLKRDFTGFRNFSFHFTCDFLFSFCLSVVGISGYKGSQFPRDIFKFLPHPIPQVQSLLGKVKNMAADDDGMSFEETSEFTNSEEHFLPPGWEIRTMDDGRIYYAK